MKRRDLISTCIYMIIFAALLLIWVGNAPCPAAVIDKTPEVNPDYVYAMAHEAEVSETVQSVSAVKTVQAEPEVYVSPYRELIDGLSEEDFELLARVIYWEAGRADASFDCQRGVCEVVLNRVLSDDPQWPDTVKDVIFQKGQFAVAGYIYKGQPLQTQLDVIEAVRTQEPILPSTNYLFFATKRQSIAKDHVWIGEGKIGHWYGEAK